MTNLATNCTLPKLIRGIALKVVTGDEIVIVRHQQGTELKKRLEKTIKLAGIIAPKLGRRQSDGEEIKDEPYGFEAREFLRKKVVGKKVTFQIMYTVPASGREYGVLYLGEDTSGENLNDLLLSEGLVGVKLNKKDSPEYKRLLGIEISAKSSGRGKWSNDALSLHVRDIKWSVGDPQVFLDKMRGRRIPAVIEFVRNGSTMRALLLPEYYNVQVILSGAQSPEIKLDREGKPDPNGTEPYAEDAKLFLESHLLHQDVEIILESRNNYNFVCSVFHHSDNIAELLLSKGLARCVDWSLMTVTGGPDNLRAAERQAKEKQLGIWKNYAPVPPTLTGPAKMFNGKVLETVNGNGIVVEHPDGSNRKIFLASVRPPTSVKGKKFIRPLFEIPWMYKAREFLRKRLNGKEVDVIIDYIIPKANKFQEKVFATVMLGNVNVAEELIAKGLATVVRHRHNDDQRSSSYDHLLTAEMKAIKSAKGIHGKTDPPAHKVNDLTEDRVKAKQFFPSLERAGRTQAVVEFVASGSRLELHLPKETCLVNFSLSGILIPTVELHALTQINPYTNMAFQFTKDFCHQKDVQIEVESIDQRGNFLGWLWIDSKNLSFELVQMGLAKLHPLAKDSDYLNKLRIVEKEAQERRANIWSVNGLLISEEKAKKENLTQTQDYKQKIDYKNVLITHVTPDLTFFVQTHKEGPTLKVLTDQLRKEYEVSPPLPGAYKPQKGDICAAKYIDNCWYRALVEKVTEEQVHVFYFDYGNREVITPLRCACLSEAYQTPLPFAKEYGLAFVSLPNDEDDGKNAIKVFTTITQDIPLLLNVKYKHEGIEYVTLYDRKKEQDKGKILVEDGFLKVEPRIGKRYCTEKQQKDRFKDYLFAQDSAKEQHLNIWRYGDITDDY